MPLAYNTGHPCLHSKHLLTSDIWLEVWREVLEEWELIRWQFVPSIANLIPIWMRLKNSEAVLKSFSKSLDFHVAYHWMINYIPVKFLTMVLVYKFSHWLESALTDGCKSVYWQWMSLVVQNVVWHVFTVFLWVYLNDIVGESVLTSNAY